MATVKHLILFSTFSVSGILRIGGEAGNNRTTENDANRSPSMQKHFNRARWERDLKSPISVYLCINILDISHFDARNGQFRLDMNVKQEWMSPELDFPNDLFNENEPDQIPFVTVDGSILKEIWTPDLFILNSRHAGVESLVSEQKAVTLYKNKTVIYWSNIFTTNGCNMEFQWYPMETITCKLSLESYSYSTTRVELKWDRYIPNPVVVSYSLKMRRYALVIPLKTTTSTQSRFGRGEKYSRLEVNFIFEAQLGHALLQVFIPTFLIVALSWFSFWLGLDAIPGRVTLLVTCMLTLVTLYSGQKGDTPYTSYVKVMDIWMVACLAFVFAAISEFIIVRRISLNSKYNLEKGSTPTYFEFCREEHQVLRRASIKNSRIFSKTRPRFSPPPMKAWDVSHDSNHPVHPSKNPNKLGRNQHPEDQKLEPVFEKTYIQFEIHEKIDYVSRICFPLLFFCFCAVYWPLLLYGDRTRN